MNDKIAYELEPFNAVLIWANESSRWLQVILGVAETNICNFQFDPQW